MHAYEEMVIMRMLTPLGHPFHDLRMKSGDFRNQEKWPPLSLSFQLAGPLQTKPEAWEDDKEKDKGEVNHIHIIYVYIYIYT